ncbi:hypothetical protein ABMY28_17375 [Vibrio vulnificus]|uniref:hypothetical protein n=1 Tax=Vibrio vulnificus TaxID=672 RepID=UPI004058245D
MAVIYYVAMISHQGLIRIFPRNIEKIAAASEKLADQAKGLLGHMLVFAGRGISKITDLSAHFIRWVFQVTVGKLYSTAKRAVDAIF